MFFIKQKTLALILSLSFCFPLFADKPLIGLVTSRNGKVTYVTLAPLRYEAKRKGLKPISVSPKDSFEDGRPMELVLYSTCNAGEPEEEVNLGFRAQFLSVNFLMKPHSDDRLADYYLLPKGWFRILQEIFRGHPYFQEKGLIKIANSSSRDWNVDIERTDVATISYKTNYSIRFSRESDEPLFIQALKEAAQTAESQNPQVTLLLESPSLFVKATYALIYKGKRQYQTIKSMNILNIWSKQQKGCPL